MISTRTFARAASTSIVTLLLAACGGSSSGIANGDGGATGASGSTCAKINLADVQALVPPIVSHSDTDPINCVYVLGDGKKLDVTDFSDADMKDYKNISSSTDQQISGIGDEAFWNEPLDGQSPPQLAAHKGSSTCVIQSDDPPDTTLKTTPNQSGLYTVAPADALAYVQLMGKVCNDLFANQSN